MVVVLIIRGVSQICWGQLCELSLSIRLYLCSNLLIGCTSSNLILQLPSMSSLVYSLFMSQRLIQKDFSSMMSFSTYVENVPTIANESFFHLSPIDDASSKCSLMHSFFLKCILHSSLYSLLCDTHFIHVLLSDWPPLN